MNTYPHDWHRLRTRGYLGWECRHRRERRYWAVMCVLATVALVGVLCMVGAIQ